MGCLRRAFARGEYEKENRDNNTQRDTCVHRCQCTIPLYAPLTGAKD